MSLKRRMWVSLLLIMVDVHFFREPRNGFLPYFFCLLELLFIIKDVKSRYIGLSRTSHQRLHSSAIISDRSYRHLTCPSVEELLVGLRALGDLAV